MSSGGVACCKYSAFDPALVPALEKILRCQEEVARGELDPADLVLRSLSKTETNERCGLRVGPSLVELAVGGGFPASKASHVLVVRGTFGVLGKKVLRCWMAEVVRARRTPGGRYLSLGSKVKTKESSESDESLPL